MEPSQKIRTKRVRTKLSRSAKKIKTSKDVVLPFDPVVSHSHTGILTGIHGVAFWIHSFLDLPTLVALFSTCKAGRFRQTSGWAWQPLFVGHGLPVPITLQKPLPAFKLVTRFTKTPTVAAKAVYKAIKDGVHRRNESFGVYDLRFGLLNRPLTELEDKIRAQDETIGDEKCKIEALKEKLATAESRLDWLKKEKEQMERLKPLSVIFDHAKKATKNLNKVLTNRRKSRGKRKSAISSAPSSLLSPLSSFSLPSPLSSSSLPPPPTPPTDLDSCNPFADADVIDLTNL